MKKILLLLIVGVLFLSSFGAVALKSDHEKLGLKTIESKIPVKEGRDFTHTVLAEFGTTSSCPHCPAVSGYLYDIYNSGDYDFYFITLNADKEPLANSRYWEIPGASGYVPQVFFDGGYSTLIGNQGSKTPYENKIENAGARSVADIDLEVSVDWLGDAEIEVTVGVTNNEGNSYSGHLHAYVTEIESRWYDYSGNKYHFSMIGYVFNKNINVDAGDTWSDTDAWDGDSHGYGNIQEDNIMIVAAVFDPSSEFVDETAAVTSENNPPEKPTITGPTTGDPGVEYNFTFKTTDPDGDDVYYYIDWDDGDVEWTDSYESGEEVTVAHTYSENGSYKIEAKAKDTDDAESEWSDPFTIIIGNIAPEAPEITGKTKGEVNVEYEYTFVTTDLNDDQVYYWIEWGDSCPAVEWIGPYPSDEPISMNHTYESKGEYTISAKAKDTFDEEGPWGYLEVEMPVIYQKNQQSSKPYLKNLTKNTISSHIITQILNLK